jgi:HSP20 family protein
MEPIKSYIERAWESLTEGWRELLARSTGALTHFRARDIGREEDSREGFPRWSLLAGETWETALSIVIRVEIPGVSKDDLAVDILGPVLRIRGEKRSGEEEHGTHHYHLMERAYGHFERHIPLPHGVDAESAEVSYRDGVLTVILPKTEPVPPRHLPVSD